MPWGKVLLVPLFVLGLTACAGHKRKALKAGPGEVVVVGRIHAYENGIEVSPGTRFLFNESTAGFYRTLAPKDSGYFVLRLPHGQNWITRMEYLGRSVHFTKDFATMNLADSGAIHYIGDIRVTFAFGSMEATGGGAGALGAVGGLAGVATGLLIDHLGRNLKGPSDYLPVSFEISSDFEAAHEFLQGAYKTDGEMIESLLTIRDGPKIEHEVLDTSEDSE